jgi:ABC-type antimicrobial peptide transport system ATPase subunit
MSLKDYVINTVMYNLQEQLPVIFIYLGSCIGDGGNY